MISVFDCQYIKKQSKTEKAERFILLVADLLNNNNENFRYASFEENTGEVYLWTHRPATEQLELPNGKKYTSIGWSGRGTWLSVPLSIKVKKSFLIARGSGRRIVVQRFTESQ